MTTIYRDGHISAKVLAYSKTNNSSAFGYEYSNMLTYELKYPRFIHSEVMTHRMLSKNAASSRAIPIKAMHEQILAVPQAPTYWGKNQAGMQAKEELGRIEKISAKAIWNEARDSALAHARMLDQVGLHKQSANRVTEPYMQMKVIMSGTEFENLFWLRDHEMAQPEFKLLAEAMVEAREAFGEPIQLEPGQWHLPYITSLVDGSRQFFSVGGKDVDLDTAIKVSASCCAQVSYRKNDESVDKALRIYKQLIENEPMHASPIEHQATPIDYQYDGYWENIPGVTHMLKDGALCSGNLRDWIQYRQTLEGHTKW